MEEFNIKIRRGHPHLWPLLEEMTAKKTIRNLAELQNEIITQAGNTIMQRQAAAREFTAQHGPDAVPKTLAEQGDPNAQKLMALAQKNLNLRELLQIASQK